MILLTSFSGYAQQKDVDILKIQLAKLRTQPNFQTSDTTHINLLNKLAHKLTFYQPDSLLILAKEARLISQSSGYIKGSIEAYIGIGQYYLNNGQHSKAICQYEQAQVLAAECGIQKFIISSHRVLAEAYEFKDNFATALDHYLIALELAEKGEDNKILSEVNQDIGILYARQHDFEHALYYFNISKKLNESINDEIFVAKNLINLSELHLELKKYNLAMHYANSSISVFEKHENFEWLAYAYEVKGTTYLRQKKYDWALFWYKQSQTLFKEKVKDERAEIFLLKGLSQVNLGIDSLELSETYALKGFEIAKRHNIKVGIKDHANNLYQINKQKSNFKEALDYHELYEQISDSMLKNESVKSMVMLKVQLNHEQQKEALIAENQTALAKQKNYIYVTLAILLILSIITILMLRNQSIQKKLNSELSQKKNVLEKQKLELNKLNKTKDKLFSIIGHDLRGPIGALQGILQLFQNNEIQQEELTTFVPKLLGDIDHISFTLNNLLSWGQSQMNGSTTKPSKVALASVVNDNINLLSEIAEGKAIKMTNQLLDSTYAWADIDQIDIVIRNLISNALKFTPIEGQITVNARENGEFWEIIVIDTGIGMDAKTQAEIFEANSTITTYGTNNEKGTGLGLSLCKEMVENNNGSIWVESSLNDGSRFYFTVPKVNETYEKAS